MKQSLLWKSVVCLWTILAFISSCTTVNWVGVERLQPIARSKVPAKVRRVAVVNNQPNLAEKNMRSTDLKALDSKMVVDSLAQYLADAVYFDEVLVFDSMLATNPVLSCDERELSPVKVKQLANMLQVDMLISVEMAALLLGDSYTGGQVFSVVKLYIPGELFPVDTIRSIQRLRYEELYPIEHIPVQEAAFLPLASLVPQWHTVDFPYYSGANVDMRDAAVYVREGNWMEAKVLWEKQLKNKNSRRRMEANLNMAVWHELNDDSITTARNYAEKALALAARKMKKRADGRWKNQTFDYLFISDYLQDMEKRGKELERLKKQLWHFSDEF